LIWITHWCVGPVGNIRWLNWPIRDAQMGLPYPNGWEVYPGRYWVYELFLVHLYLPGGLSRECFLYNHSVYLLNTAERADTIQLTGIIRVRVLAASPGLMKTNR